MSFFSELKRRNVFKVGVAYLVACWLALQIADLVLENIHAPDWIMQVIMLGMAIGFPFALIVAWAFEVTPEGVKLHKNVDPEKSIGRHTGHQLNRGIIVILSMAIVLLLTDKFRDDLFGAADPGGVKTEQGNDVAGEMQAGENKTSIAVLPFRDMSATQDQGYFGEGIAEELLNALVKIKGLDVASRTSSFSLAGENLDTPAIAAKLGVNHIVEGSVRTSGQQVRVTAQLIDAGRDVHLWSETYDGSLDDIFKIQDDIASSIMTSLKVHLLGEQEHAVTAERTRDLDAYRDYLIGKERLSLATREDIEAARDKFDRAIAADPEYAPARVALAHAWLLLEREAYGKADKKVVDAVVTPQLEKALELAPDLPEAIAIRGLHHLQRYRYEEARNDLNRAIHLNPNYALAYLWRSETWYEQEQYLQMLADKEKAYSLDPMSLEIASQLAFDYGSFWRPRDADRIIARMFELHPGHPRAYRALAANLSNHGRYGEAALLLEEAMAAHPDTEPFQEAFKETLCRIQTSDSIRKYWIAMLSQNH